MREFRVPDYTYRVSVDRVIDGDTIDVLIDVGFYSTTFKRLRLLEIDTEELRSSDEDRREKAKLAKARVEEILFEEAEQVYIQTEMDAKGKYGRLLAYVWYEKDGDKICLNKQLVEEGFEKVE